MLAAETEQEQHRLLRKTKIVCTIGPKTASFEAIKGLAELGMNVARLNMSHGTQDWHLGVIKNIKRYNKKFAGSLAIMLDTRGAEIRSGDLKQDLALKVGDILTLTTRRQAELEPYCVEVSHDGFVAEVAPDDIILVDGGMLRLRVLGVGRTDIRCQSLDEGVLSSRRHLNVRGKSAELPTITEQDWRDIEFGIDQRVDFIALSFVREAGPIVDLQKRLQARGVAMEVFAKIESAASIPELDDIIAVADGVMIARGDLGAELPYEDVPLLQDEIIAKCRRAGKPVIVATHMLESMIVNPTPTRAEVTDITHAVQQGADAIMLSGETATGRYPRKALEVMGTVAGRIERHLAAGSAPFLSAREDRLRPKREIAHSAAMLSNNLQAVGTLVITRRGLMAALLSQCRPRGPIFAFTNTTHVRRRLGIYWGVQAFVVALSSDPEVTIQRAIEQLLRKGVVRSGEKIIVLSDILAGGKFVETVQVRVI
ncbi:pyruvate kinase [Desulfurivibrio alkaliphilus]|uniref:Pyruvate kinase n=1 Tax=Desulfurivibrio alkaliphilus (strain DSM 19089 / UNIQEM U267 / AHT2) TaxID=589865 RepID=D6Z321_DESAT|nr:pyruvate kinase [Desulfurivibrio alkaliphilus]ADH85946.1 pyruvate kinase [Desulfurivibrio alkaliphilus AHT 2]